MWVLMWRCECGVREVSTYRRHRQKATYCGAYSKLWLLHNGNPYGNCLRNMVSPLKMSKFNISCEPIVPAYACVRKPVMPSPYPIFNPVGSKSNTAMLMHWGSGVMNTAATLAKRLLQHRHRHNSSNRTAQTSPPKHQTKHTIGHNSTNIKRISPEGCTKSYSWRRGGGNDSASASYTQSPFCSDLSHAVACCPRTGVKIIT